MEQQTAGSPATHSIDSGQAGSGQVEHGERQLAADRWQRADCSRQAVEKN